MATTAVEWFAKQVLRARQLGFISNEKFNELLEQAKEMEKEQIEKAYVYGAAYGIDISNNLSPDMYYNQTFKNQ